ncbi:MAG: NADH-quinone oxidoreductase subunit NuoH [Halobacteriovoraceae bacterium]|jgi:NADH-quinone oxidoreductase subunit H|nr:NADH-quinone oxidoreductase subunit NuoH [Halobacteriovoraceae bacterium]
MKSLIFIVSLLLISTGLLAEIPQVVTIASIVETHYQNQDIFKTLFFIVLPMIGALTFITVLALTLVYLERKIAAHFQCRLGPMRVGFHGILQPIADAIKLLNKEDLIPKDADKLLHFIAPFIAMVGTVLGMVAIPFAPNIQVIDLDIGLLYLAAVSGIGVFAVLLAGWGSHNKWSLLGAMRAAAQLISYELSITIVLVVVVLFTGSLKLSEIIYQQDSLWWIFKGHIVSVIAFFIFFTASLAELNRTPFDLPEGEAELGAGFHTEYSGMRFSFFFLAEFINMFLACALMTTIFFGGWLPFHIQGLDALNSVMDLLPPLAWFMLKTSTLIFLMMWIRWTFPRLRIDQLMKLEWKFLLPLGLINIVLAAIVVSFKWYFFA